MQPDLGAEGGVVGHPDAPLDVEHPVDVAVDPGGDAVYVRNRGGGTQTVIDTATRGVV